MCKFTAVAFGDLTIIGSQGYGIVDEFSASDLTDLLHKAISDYEYLVFDMNDQEIMLIKNGKIKENYIPVESNKNQEQLKLEVA